MTKSFNNHNSGQSAGFPSDSGYKIKKKETISRRGLIKWGTLLCSFCSALGFAGILQSYLSAGQTEPLPRRFAVGRWEEFPRGRVVQKAGLYLRKDEQGLLAFKGVCPHLGCRFRWDEKQGVYECPCHGSRFDASGRYLSGPAKKALEPVFLHFDDKGEVIADLLEPVKEGFRLRGLDTVSPL
jgi:nitrite reductase/ring-hydroxylating ferredoxin subunit